MVKIDENQEGIVRIQMAVDIHDLAVARILAEETENNGDTLPSAILHGSHWKLGSPLKMITAQEGERQKSTELAVRHFEAKPISFLQEHLPGEQINLPMKVNDIHTALACHDFVPFVYRFDHINVSI